MEVSQLPENEWFGGFLVVVVDWVFLGVSVVCLFIFLEIKAYIPSLQPQELS